VCRALDGWSNEVSAPRGVAVLGASVPTRHAITPGPSANPELSRNELRLWLNCSHTAGATALGILFGTFPVLDNYAADVRLVSLGSGSVKLVLRSALAILTGIPSSVIVHFAALEYIWHSHGYNGRFAAVFFTPGSWLAGRGFETQSVVLPLNVLAYAVLFSATSFLLPGRRARQKLSE
jgi:hypothetical protein